MNPFVRTWLLLFFDFINDPNLLEIARTAAYPNAFTRNRKLNFHDTILTILDVGRETTSLKLRRLCKRYKVGKKKLEISQQAFSKARNQISELPFRTLFEKQIEAEYQGKMGKLPTRSKNGWTYLAIDGMKIALPNLPELVKKYFSTGAGQGSPTALGSCLFDICNNRLIDADFSPVLDERASAVKHMKRYAQLCPGDLTSMFIFDRGYPSIELIRKFELMGMIYLMRCRSKFNCKIDALPLGCDTTITIKGSKVRVIKFLLKSGQLETLITNDHEHKTEEFKDLYFLRWGAENIYDLLKNRFQLENFTGKTENTIKQDFWATILAATMLMVLEEDVTPKIRKERERKDNKHTYQVNRNIFVGIMREDLIYALTAESKLALIRRMKKLIKDAKKFVCSVKPGRTVKRAKNKRKSKFHHNLRSNC